MNLLEFSRKSLSLAKIGEKKPDIDSCERSIPNGGYLKPGRCTKPSFRAVEGFSMAMKNPVLMMLALNTLKSSSLDVKPLKRASDAFR